MKHSYLKNAKGMNPDNGARMKPCPKPRIATKKATHIRPQSK